MFETDSWFLSGAARYHFAAADVVLHSADKEKLVDPMYRLEHQGEDERKGKEAAPLLVRLQRSADLKHGDPYSRNKALRAELRVRIFEFHFPTPRYTIQMFVRAQSI